MQPRQVYACDIGSTRHERSKDPKFAWVRVTPDRSPIAIGSHSIESLVNYLGKDLRAGFSIAIGFEAPLFFPVPIRSDRLSLFSTLGQFQFPSSTLTASRGPNLPQDGLAAVLNL
jgi:hypothetical protein